MVDADQISDTDYQIRWRVRATNLPEREAAWIVALVLRRGSRGRYRRAHALSLGTSDAVAASFKSGLETQLVFSMSISKRIANN